MLENDDKKYNAKKQQKKDCMSVDVKKNLGIMFREKRQEMHLSLKEVENAISIRMTYLQAIEEGEIEKYLSPVYGLGFIKQYATFLGFDAEKIVKENSQAFKRNTSFQEFDYGIGTLDVRNTNRSSAKRGSNVLWGFVSVGVLIIAWFLAKALGVI